MQKATSASLEMLVVEGDPELRQILLEILRTAGHSARSVANGSEALGELAAARLLPSLIITDTKGWGPLSALRTHKRFYQIPVLVTGARARDEANDAWATFLSKALDTSMFLQAVGNCLRPGFGWTARYS